MRDYELEKFLMHYGVPGMKRPSGLKYKTRGVRNVYANRLTQMRKRSGNESSESSTYSGRRKQMVEDLLNGSSAQKRKTAIDYLEEGMNKAGKRKSAKDYFEEGMNKAGKRKSAKDYFEEGMNKAGKNKKGADFFENTIKNATPKKKKKKTSRSWRDKYVRESASYNERR